MATQRAQADSSRRLFPRLPSRAHAANERIWSRADERLATGGSPGCSLAHLANEPPTGENFVVEEIKVSAHLWLQRPAFVLAAQANRWPRRGARNNDDEWSAGMPT